ncbi:MAG: prepilin-type N-terminal cleavage/methylation domain-containing protein [Patescibacteria group bacterium]
MSNHITKNQGGFTLIELMIVVVIIGILATLIIPIIVHTPQREAKACLMQIYKAQEDFKTQHGYYYGSDFATVCADSSIPTLALEPRSGSEPTQEVQIPNDSPYMFCISSKDNGETFVAGAQANLDDDPAMDEIRIDERGKIFVILNDLE